MKTCVIIDDEERSVETLETIITRFLEDKLEILGTANNANKGFELITEKKPQLVFLDIEMPHGSGFDLLEMFSEPNFEVIFTTGFAQYAINAIKFSAIDYLLKPINISELIKSVDKAISRIDSGGNSTNDLQLLLNNIKRPKSKENKVPLPVMKGLEMVRVKDIIYCKADEDYTHVYLNLDNQKLVVTKSIKDFEELLTEYDFFRVHHSFLVNKDYIKKYIKGEGGNILTENGVEIPVSRRKKNDFISWLKNN